MSGASSASESRPSRLFFSLRWKVLGVLALVLAATFAGFSYTQYQTLQTQYRLASSQRLETNRRALAASLRESASELQQLVNQWGASLRLPELSADTRLADRLPPQLTLTLDALAVYGPGGRSLGEWSVGRGSGLQPLRARDSIARAFAESQPVSILGCDAVCYQYSFVPVITADNEEIVVAATRSIVGAIASFSRLTGDDLALIAGLAGLPAGEETAQRLVAVTNAAQMQPIAVAAEQQLATLDEPGPFTIRHDGRRFLADAQPLADNAVGEPIHALLLMDVTATLKAIESAVLRSNLLAAASLITGLLLVLALLSGPLTRLRTVASALPRLPARQFPEAMAQIASRKRQRLVTDETDVLRDTAVDLIEQLQLLQHAEDASRAKSEFLATMSHEIRTPLSAVISLLELHAGSRLDVAQTRLVGTARDAANTLLTVINDILDMSKVEAGKLELETTEFDLPTLVEAVTDSLSLHAREKNLALHCLIDPDIPRRVFGDSLRIRQILFNLIGNAIKFSQAGEITIEVRPIELHNARFQLHFEVCDQGIGIDESLLENIFSPFTQAQSSTTRRFGGTGLGLTICRRLVELMRGEIGVHSRPGNGSRFWFRIPLRTGTNRKEKPGLQGLCLRACVHSDFEYRALQAYLGAMGARIERGAPQADAVSDEQLRTARRDGVDGLFCEQGNGLQPARAADLAMLGTGRPLALVSTQVPDGVRQVQGTPVLAWLARPLHRDNLLCAVARAFERDCAENPSGLPGASTDELSSRLRGRRVLAAEDNPTSGMVIKLQLERLGAIVTLVENGQAALDALSEARFDALITDLHMPEMDGYELTRRIRQQEKHASAATRLPVIALSASTLGDGEALALRAGMDLFLHKPTHLAELESVLGDLLTGQEVTSPSHPQPPAEHAPPLDPGVLDASIGNDPALRQSILSAFAATLTADRQALQARADQRDMQALREAAHKLRGSARIVGAGGLATALDGLEAAAAEDSDDAVRHALETVQAECRRLDEIIRPAFAGETGDDQAT